MVAVLIEIDVIQQAISSQIKQADLLIALWPYADVATWPLQLIILGNMRCHTFQLNIFALVHPILVLFYFTFFV